MKLFNLTLLVLILVGCFCGQTQAQAQANQDTLHLVQTRGSRSDSNLSHSLQAVLDSGGTLKGNDSAGRFIIAIPAGNEQKLAQSKSVVKSSTTVPPQWDAVGQLTLSYDATNKPTEQELKNLGLKLIEDYVPGSFLIVALANGGSIDAQLVQKLKDWKKIQYATPVFKINALR